MKELYLINNICKTNKKSKIKEGFNYLLNSLIATSAQSVRV